ncbi:VENN motif pre-toxin domain-containing protein [Pectobacterium colocasium]|nr:hemagglutinin repeat-containing protein [Pectobacterium colocasium]
MMLLSHSNYLNAAKGRETGTGNSWSETTVDAGNHVTLKSERDTRLTGAQVNGERIDVDAGRNLLLQSQQDSERYDSRQVSGSAGGSFTWGGGGGSGYISLSKDRMHSNYDSVQQQTGLFAGKDGFGIKTGEHTQLDAAVIGSTASADKNRLDTGTLGWSGLSNKAEFKVEHSGAGFSASPSLNGSLLSTLAMNVPSALMALGSRGNASSTTYAAVSDGTLLLRDTAKQVQDITTLSRDVEHANNALSPIFNKEKEQKRLKQAQLIGEIGAQMMDIVRTEGELKAQKAAEAKGDAKVKRPQDGDSAQEWEVYKKALTESPTYKAEMQKYGTGSDFQRAAQAATAAIQALAGGDIQKAIASGASPYLAQLVKDVTLPKDESKITASDIAANAMAHAVVGAVVAQLSGQDAAAGAIGASSGELAARAIMAEQYPGKTANDLTEEEKQSVSALSTLASGLISGLASNSTATAASGAQSGRNAVENNLFGFDSKSTPQGLRDFGQSATSLYTNTNLTDENGNVLNPITEEERQYAMHRLVTGVMPEGQDISKAIVNGYTNGVLIAGAWYLGPAASVAKVVGGAIIGEIANGTYQWFDINSEKNQSLPVYQQKTWDYKGSISAGITGALAPGRGVWANLGIAQGGAIFTDGLDKGALSGTSAGWAFGTAVGLIAPPLFDPVLGSGSAPVGDIIGAIGGEFISNAVKDEVNEKKK